MKTTVSLILGAAVVALAFPASAEGLHAKKLKSHSSTATRQVQTNSNSPQVRRLQRLSAKMNIHNQFGFAPTFGGYGPYAYEWGGPYASYGAYNSFAYVPGPYVGPGYDGYGGWYGGSFIPSYNWGPGVSVGVGFDGLGFSFSDW